MYISFEELPQTARIWIYQANRPLNIEEVELISAKIINFIEQWTRHGEDLKGSFTLKYNQFLVLAVDESFNNVSGCSIDASVRLVKELEDSLNIDFTDKLNVAFKEDNSINIVRLSEFQEYIKQGEVNEQTIVFNNMVQSKNDLEFNWEVPAKQSWHKRFL